MKAKLSDEQNDAILKALDRAINNDTWEKSNFLKMIGKNLNQLRDDFLKRTGLAYQASSRNEANLAKIEARSSQQEVYISLYSSTGGNFQSWEKIIQSLSKQLISRPIYAQEEDIKSALKTKENKINEAYIAIYVNKKDLLTLPKDKAPIDKLGITLLSLKDKSLLVENISRFVHSSGIYTFDNGRLIKN